MRQMSIFSLETNPMFQPVRPDGDARPAPRHMVDDLNAQLVALDRFGPTGVGAALVVAMLALVDGSKTVLEWTRSAMCRWHGCEAH
jgi:hypothetical protein